MKRGVKRSAVHKTATRSKSSGTVRIISGRFRGRKLPVIDVSGLRPTTDRNKEMLFNWLMPFTQDARCLDAFAGSGGLGFEALSRNAKHCTFIELDNRAVGKLAENTQLLGLSDEQARLIKGSALEVIESLQATYDLIFIDPPFNLGLIPPVLTQIVEAESLAINGVIYIECEGQGADYSVPNNWQLIKQKSSAQVVSRIYQRVA